MPMKSWGCDVIPSWGKANKRLQSSSQDSVLAFFVSLSRVFAAFAAGCDTLTPAITLGSKNVVAPPASYNRLQASTPA